MRYMSPNVAGQWRAARVIGASTAPAMLVFLFISGFEDSPTKKTHCESDRDTPDDRQCRYRKYGRSIKQDSREVRTQFGPNENRSGWLKPRQHRFQKPEPPWVGMIRVAKSSPRLHSKNERRQTSGC